MAISLDGLELPQDLEWQDEFDWTPVASSSERGLTGKLLREEAPLVKGRPITLYGGPNACWVPRSLVQALKALEMIPGQTMALDYHGQLFTVCWNRSGSQSAIDAKPVMRIRNPGESHKYYITLRLMEVA
ncbi:hypothetical protein [Marinobacterium stanieri]|uniref:hypothetical protein n=1 Tax=Marinobacterium stanieri TaxID=49186 RepID=UPI0002558F0E|nr:hypothetical protein [Marinobacterium stanieri]